MGSKPTKIVDECISTDRDLSDNLDIKCHRLLETSSCHLYVFPRPRILTAIAIQDEIKNINCGDGCIVTTTKNHHYVYGTNKYGQLGLNNKWIQNSFTLNPYFKDRKITIDKICLSSNSSTTFWISSDGTLYGNGRNGSHQLGHEHKTKLDRPSPEKIKGLQGVIDIHSSVYGSIALSGSLLYNLGHIRLAIASWIAPNYDHSR